MPADRIKQVGAVLWRRQHHNLVQELTRPATNLLPRQCSWIVISGRLAPFPLRGSPVGKLATPPSIQAFNPGLSQYNTKAPMHHSM